MTPRITRLLCALAAPAFCAALLSGSGVARAEDGPEGGEESIEAKIKAQLEKIVRLMKENESALLEASRGAVGKKPEGPDVKPPDVPPMEGEVPPAAGEPPQGERGAEIRKRIEELLKTTSEKGGAIPKEIEELIKMIPRTQSRSEQDPEDSDPQRNQEGEARKPRQGGEDPKDPKKDPKEADKPKDPAKDPYERGNDKPPEADKGDPPNNDLPPWIVGLPPEQQRKIMNGDTKDVPPEYRGLVERYLKWLNEHSGK